MNHTCPKCGRPFSVHAEPCTSRVTVVYKKGVPRPPHFEEDPLITENEKLKAKLKVAVGDLKFMTERYPAGGVANYAQSTLAKIKALDA